MEQQQQGLVVWLGLVVVLRAAWCLDECNATCLQIHTRACESCKGAIGPFQAFRNEAFLFIDAPDALNSPTSVDSPSGRPCAVNDILCQGPPSTEEKHCCASCEGETVKCKLFTFSPSFNKSNQNTVQVFFWNEADGPSTRAVSTTATPPPPHSCSSAGCNSTLGSCSRKACPPGCRCKKSSKKTMFIIGGASGAGLLFVLVCLIVFVARRRHLSARRRCRSDRAQILTDATCAYTPMVFTFRELKTATKSFAESRLLGGGGFSTVYQGKLPDGRIVAVKKLNQGNKQGIQQFQNEVNILSQVRHPNLVQLLGYCLEGRDLLLVYEFVLNGTLADHLHGEKGNGLSLETRITIALETAQALAYLHFYVKPPIYHRDVKTSNILLDKDFKAKVADFGLSRLTHLDATHISTAPQGTPGYLDPDYHESYQLTDKSDVYSFGVVLLELISRKKAVDMTRDKKEINLASMALARIHSGALHELFDPDLSVKYWKLLTRLVEVAFRCLAAEKDDRPSMVEVVRELEQLSGMTISSSSSKKSSRFKLEHQSSGELRKQRSVASTNMEEDSPTSVQVKWPSTHTSPSNSRSEIYN
ncbi:wall-associated receptor kinase-like 14 [Selaginella moellendorffii]|nr:wall-associated receptor kinase-like 14 [Selaginella moellendorffii]|eukprot:XP_002960238.2 wall-associated receptor kinase-like 14 [Selaginella moellendorffii]